LHNKVFVNVTNPVLSLPDNNHSYGSAGRNSVRFDSFHQLDMGLHKTFSLYPESLKFDFRFEAFNVLNQTNYAFPSSGFSPTFSSFGVVSASSTFPPRVLQFAGKIIF